MSETVYIPTYLGEMFVYEYRHPCGGRLRQTMQVTSFEADTWYAESLDSTWDDINLDHMPVLVKHSEHGNFLVVQDD